MVDSLGLILIELLTVNDLLRVKFFCIGNLFIRYKFITLKLLLLLQNITNIFFKYFNHYMVNVIFFSSAIRRIFRIAYLILPKAVFILTLVDSAISLKLMFL